jgi:hypothetical protein
MLIHFRGGPWAGKKHFSLAPGMTSIPVPADEENPVAGKYVLAEKLGDVRGENAIGYGFDWVPEEDEDSPADGKTDPDPSDGSPDPTKA